MSIWGSLLRSERRRHAERERGRLAALAKSRTALRRERRSIVKRQAKAEELRRKAVDYERQGKPGLARQLVRQFVQIDKETLARTMALNNMDYALDQVQTKDNYEDFARGMEVVARLEELARESVDPDQVRERLWDLAQRNQDLVEPWTETPALESPVPGEAAALTAEEQEAYGQVVNEAAAAIETDDVTEPSSVFAQMDGELEQKMKEALT